MSDSFQGKSWLHLLVVSATIVVKKNPQAQNRIMTLELLKKKEGRGSPMYFVSLLGRCLSLSVSFFFFFLNFRRDGTAARLRPAHDAAGQDC
jgi:hypothetical protein